MSYKLDWSNLRAFPCPKCGRKGLHQSNHPHAFGHKDYERCQCRFCKARFKRAPISPVK